MQLIKIKGEISVFQYRMHEKEKFKVLYSHSHSVYTQALKPILTTELLKITVCRTD
jgi:hypothetical protein